MTEHPVYEEEVTSHLTEALFVVLGLFFLALSAWRVAAVGFGPSTIIFLCLFGFFLFCALNYRVFFVRITPAFVKLDFGVFARSVPLDMIEACHIDQMPIWRVGGAGIHFTVVNRKYRVMFNFLEHQRVVLVLKNGGLVREVAFSTRRPEEVARIITAAINGMAAKGSGPIY